MHKPWARLNQTNGGLATPKIALPESSSLQSIRQEPYGNVKDVTIIITIITISSAIKKAAESRIWLPNPDVFCISGKVGPDGDILPFLKKKRASFQTSCFCIPGQNGIHSYLGKHLTALYQFPGKLISVTLTEIISQTDYYLVCLQKIVCF